LDVCVDGRVAWVRFDRPERRNGETTETAVEMYGALTELAARDDESARYLAMLTGAGEVAGRLADQRGTPPATGGQPPG
jgi:2-(1,2-epoxy-1,2-dihydrophenyl)acetyl-CoA isomerase